MVKPMCSENKLEEDWWYSYSDFSEARFSLKSLRFS